MATYYNWREKFDQLTVAEAKRPQQLEDENTKLKKLVAGQTLDNIALKDLLSKSSSPRDEEHVV